MKGEVSLVWDHCREPTQEDLVISKIVGYRPITLSTLIFRWFSEFSVLLQSVLEVTC